MMRILIIYAVYLGGSVFSRAQVMPNLNGANMVSDQPLPPGIQKREQAFIDSQARFFAGDYAAAEATLVAGNQSTPGTPRWHCESGFMLLRMAFMFQSKADAVSSTALASRALAHLKLAEDSYSSDTTVTATEIANEKEMTGYVYDKLLGNRQAAKQYYKAAVNLSPDTGHAADLLAAISAFEAAEAQKLSGTGNN